MDKSMIADMESLLEADKQRMATMIDQLQIRDRSRNDGRANTRQAGRREMRESRERVNENITERSYKELEARKNRVSQLEKVYMDMTKELQKNGRKRKLREDEIVNPTNRPVYKWFAERKRVDNILSSFSFAVLLLSCDWSWS
ncbi:hypothetical protein TSUD_109640 [Trifolium subterraneum]|uniref:Uncharacterized protein n=1 Tax=Trifolium subterraneum TaxID=3900 RepID=A0A2Z6M5I2_TRISU|nr:hypothetical protein TSUD_109640 [Trifolium subterraneum]